MRLTSLSILLIAIASCVHAQSAEQKFKEWRDLKYSMFIHYGIYSVLGGVWDGKQIHRGLSEQIQAHAGIYSDTYASVADEFNPLKWNADSIALLAKSAGMRSIVITSKHHDGFCMFQSDHTDFDVVDATPFKRDIVKELSDACRRHGLKFGLYFSLIDWHYPQASPISSHNSDYITPEHHAYNKKQVTELLTRYGSISELWFDMGSQSIQQSKELRDLVHGLQPDCKVSSRIGNDQGDFTVMGDNQQPDYSIGVPWQSPASFFDETWGYRSWQQRGDEKEKAKEKLTSLIQVASRGGNYLLNIGPKGDGSVVDFEKRVLLKNGKWLAKNGEAIYSTLPDPFQVSFDWGNITTSADGQKMYLHVRTLPAQGIIDLPGLKGGIKRVYILEDNSPAKFSSDEAVRITLPKSFTVDDEFKVVVIEFKDKFSITPHYLLVEQDNKFSLSSKNSFKYYSSSCIDYNTRVRSTVKESWSLLPGKSTSALRPTLFYTEGEVGKDIIVSIGGHDDAVHLESSEKVEFKNHSAPEWGPAYRTGPFSSGLDGVHGNITAIDIQKPWPSAKDNMWQLEPQWQSGKLYSYPAEMMTAYYFLQEITTQTEQPLIIQVSGGDGTMIFLNGKEQLIQLNHDRKKNVEYVVLLQLKSGKNQLLVKSFNNFRKEVVVSIAPHAKQYLYVQRLATVTVSPGKVFSASWKLNKPETPHQDIEMQNVLLELVGDKK
jgi:alpha-L-fucosidase